MFWRSAAAARLPSRGRSWSQRDRRGAGAAARRGGGRHPEAVGRWWTGRAERRSTAAGRPGTPWRWRPSPPARWPWGGAAGAAALTPARPRPGVRWRPTARRAADAPGPSRRRHGRRARVRAADPPPRAGVAFPPEQVARQAQLNASAGLLAGLAYTKTQGRRSKEFVAFAGRQFVAVWGNLPDTGAAASRAVACAADGLPGGRCCTRWPATRGAPSCSRPWPPKELAGFAGLSLAECDAVYGLFGLLAVRLGLRFVWRRDGERVVLEFAR